MNTMDDGRCNTCKEFMTFGRSSHRCQPKFFCWVEHIDGTAYMQQEDSWTVHAYDAEAAAEKFSEQWDWQDCEPLMLNGAAMVLVTAMDGETKRFSIEGEMVPSYHAREWTIDDGLREFCRAIRAAWGQIEWQLDRWKKEAAGVPEEHRKDVAWYDDFGIDVAPDWEYGSPMVLLKTLHMVKGKLEVADALADAA